MPVLIRHTLIACLALVAGSGCANMIETRAINKFADNLRAEDLDGLKTSSSPRFNERALRTTTALEDIKILHLPDGKTTIVEVEDVSATNRRVTVQVGEEKKEVFYELVVDSAGQWVVDDVYLKQKKLGVTSYKSVTEQLDLLLTVREFLDGWDAGNRDQILAVSAVELRHQLEQLPPAYLAVLTKQVLGEKSLTKNYKPRAQLDDTTALVRLPRANGETAITLELADEKWQVTDVAVDGKKKEDEQIPSVLKQALAVNTCRAFLEAYQAENKEQLQPLCDQDFFEGSLSIANLKQVLLPDPELSNFRMEVKLRGQRADFMLKGEAEIVQIEMRRVDAAEPKALPKFLVSEITIYEVESKQEKRLSALFTAQGMLELFCQALSSRDLDHLRHTSSQDFSNQVWRRLNPATVQGLPLEQFDDPTLVVDSMRFQGALTRVEAHQGGKPVTYLLREESGRFYVDDMQWETTGRPASVKRTLALMVPVQNFAAAIALGRDPDQQTMVLEMLQSTCSTDFNRMVWQQSDFVPNSGLSADSYLNAPLRSIVESDTEVLIQLGDDRYGATVKLKKEQNRELVDDITLIKGAELAERVHFKQTMRTILANGEAVAPGSNASQLAVRQQNGPAKKIQTAVYEEFEDESPREILQTSDVIDIGPTPAREPAALEPAAPRRLDDLGEQLEP